MLLDLPVWHVESRKRNRRSSSRFSAIKASDAVSFLRLSFDLWSEMEEFASLLEEQCGILELEIDRERYVNSAGMPHTPHVVDLCRLGFRNHFILNSANMYLFPTVVYSFIDHIDALMCDHESARTAASDISLTELLDDLDTLYTMMTTLDVNDDALATTGSTRDHFKKFFLAPIEQAQKKYSASTSMMSCEEKQSHDILIGSQKPELRGIRGAEDASLDAVPESLEELFKG